MTSVSDRLAEHNTTIIEILEDMLDNRWRRDGYNRGGVDDRMILQEAIQHIRELEVFTRVIPLGCAFVNGRSEETWSSPLGPIRLYANDCGIWEWSRQESCAEGASRGARFITGTADNRYLALKAALEAPKETP